MTGRRSALTVLAAAAALGALTGCSGGDDDPAPTAPASSTPARPGVPRPSVTLSPGTLSPGVPAPSGIPIPSLTTR